MQDGSPRIGDLLVDRGLVSKEQLTRALAEQASAPNETLGQILVRLGFIGERDLAQVLELTGKRRSLRDVLLRRGLVDLRRLAAGEEAARRQRLPLETVLLRLGYATEQQVAEAIAEQHDLPFVQVEPKRIDPALATLISLPFAQRNNLVPIRRDGGSVVLAASRALPVHEQRELERVVRLGIRCVIATASNVVAGQRALYGASMPTPPPPRSVEDPRNLESDANLQLILSEADVDAEDEEPDAEREVQSVSERDSLLVKIVNRLINDAHQMRASDMHIEPQPGRQDVLVRFRIDGHCRIYQRIPFRYKLAMVSRLKILAGLDIADRRRPQDGKIHFARIPGLELRVATMPTAGALEDVVVRLLPTGAPAAFEKLGLSERSIRLLEQAIVKPHGLVLVVGPTGSGKTTTLHSALRHINRPELKIWTAEDPVEITQPGLRQVQINPRIGLTFAAVLRSFLRLDPDIIMVGEMRDLETSSMALEAALTGHLVLSTLHTNSAPETVTRLLEMGLDPFSFADSLSGIVAQRLVRTLCACRQLRQATPQERKLLCEEFGAPESIVEGFVGGELLIGVPKGCSECSETGFRGRIGIHEVLLSSDAVAAMVRRRADVAELRAHAIDEGMLTLRRDGLLKVLRGVTTIQEVRAVTLR